METKGAIIVRSGMGSTLLGFESVDGYVSHPVEELETVIYNLLVKKFVVHSSDDVRVLLTNGSAMIEIRIMMFGVAVLN